MARKRANLSDLLNDLAFKTLYTKYKELAVTAFEWEGLPEGIKPKFIEEYLFTHGKAIFFKDPAMSFMCLRADDSQGINVYGEPLHYIATGYKYNKRYSADDCVIIENNPLRQNTEDFIMYYVNKLTECERTMDVNVKAVKTPFIFACDDKDVLTFKRIFQMIDGNTPAVYADKNLNLDAIQVFQTGVKFIGNELMDYKKTIDNEVLTFLGYNNIAVDKKERINVDEANSNNEVIHSFADLQLKSRQEACDAINEMYGLNISVKRREEPTNVEYTNVQHEPVNG